MMNDDELRSRMSGLADNTEIETVTLEAVQARSRRRTAQQRGVAVFAAFALVVGGAVGIAALQGDDGTDVAADDAETTIDDVDADATDGDDTVDDSTDAVVDEISTTTTIPGDTATTEFVETGSFDQAAYSGPGRIVAWGDGFLAFGDRFIPAEPVPFASDGESPIAEYFPQEILDVVEASGATNIDEASAALADAGLLDLATQIVTENPEVLDWYNTNAPGGTYESYVEYSEDGVVWEAIDGFSWPTGQSYVPQLSSNGEQLVAVVSDGTWDEETGRPLETTITVHVTSDLSTWSSVEIPVTVPNVPDYVQVDVSPNQIAVTDSGWYLTVSSWQWIDLWSLLPVDLHDEMMENGYDWNPTEAGIEIVFWDWEAYDEAYAEDAAFTDEALAEGTWEEPGRTVIRTIPWSELPLSYDEYIDAQHGGGVSQGFLGDFDGSVEEASAVPGGTEGGQVIATDAGFFTLVYDYPEFEVVDDEAFASDVYQGPTVTAHFSADGRTWNDVALPVTGENDWIDSAVGVDGGVLLQVSGAFPGQRYFLGAADGTGFVEVDGPDLPDSVHVWFSSWNAVGDGVATVVDFSQPNYPEFVAYKVTFEVDGFQITSSQDGEGGVMLTVVDGDGETVYDFAGEVYEEPPFNYSDAGVEIIDEDGELIVMVPFEVMETEIYRVESEAWDAAYNEDPHVPDFRLVASRDGRSWVVQALPAPDPDYGWYGEAIVVNGQVLVSDGTGTWTIVDLP